MIKIRVKTKTKNIHVLRAVQSHQELRARAAAESAKKNVNPAVRPAKTARAKTAVDARRNI